jgi:hypothetical protein
VLAFDGVDILSLEQSFETNSIKLAVQHIELIVHWIKLAVHQIKLVEH